MHARRRHRSAELRYARPIVWSSARHFYPALFGGSDERNHEWGPASHHQLWWPDLQDQKDIIDSELRSTRMSNFTTNLPSLRLTIAGILLAFAPVPGWSTNRGPDSGN